MPLIETLPWAEKIDPHHSIYDCVGQILYDHGCDYDSHGCALFNDEGYYSVNAENLIEIRGEDDAEIPVYLSLDTLESIEREVLKDAYDFAKRHDLVPAVEYDVAYGTSERGSGFQFYMKMGLSDRLN